MKDPGKGRPSGWGVRGLNGRSRGLTAGKRGLTAGTRGLTAGTRDLTDRATGFTLIEMLVTLLMMAILLGIGMPSFVNLIRNNGMTDQANSVLGGIIYARQEATNLGIGVSICGSSDQKSCDGQWGEGWIVFKDPNGTVTGTVAATSVLRLEKGSSSIDASSGAAVRFDQEGIRRALTQSADTVTLKRSDCGNEGSRIISILAGGQASVGDASC